MNFSQDRRTPNLQNQQTLDIFYSYVSSFVQHYSIFLTKQVLLREIQDIDLSFISYNSENFVLGENFQSVIESFLERNEIF